MDFTLEFRKKHKEDVERVQIPLQNIVMKNVLLESTIKGAPFEQLQDSY